MPYITILSCEHKGCDKTVSGERSGHPSNAGHQADRAAKRHGWTVKLVGMGYHSWMCKEHSEGRDLPDWSQPNG